MLTYTECKAKLGNRSSLKLANNTYLERCGSRQFGIYLHGTRVVTISANGTYTVTTGGYKTETTKDRINEFSPARIFQKNGEWFSCLDRWEGCKVQIPFKEGMKVRA